MRPCFTPNRSNDNVTLHCSHHLSSSSSVLSSISLRPSIILSSVVIILLWWQHFTYWLLHIPFLLSAHSFPYLDTLLYVAMSFLPCISYLFAELERLSSLELNYYLTVPYGTGSAFSFLARRKRWWSSCVDINQEPPFHCAWIICIEGKDQSKQLLPVIFLLYADSLIYILYLLSQCWSDSTISLHNCYICYATLMLISSPIVCSEGYCCWIVWRRYREMLTRTREGNEIWKKFAFWNKASKKGDLRLRWKLYASYERDFSLINLYISEHQLQSVRINYRLSLIEKLCCLYFLVASSCLYY